MRGQLAILCYHRVMHEASRSGDGWPYFRRGTAVSLGTFTRHIEQIARRVTVVDEPAVLAWVDDRRGIERPSVWITFDDGYADFVEQAAPQLLAAGMTASVFITTCTLASPPQALPADRWYAALARARRSRGVLAIEGDPWPFDLDRPGDRARLVDGPERRRCLRAGKAEQEAMFSALSEALGAPTDPSPGLYLSVEELHGIARQGFSIGAHGATHTPFSALDQAGLESELDAITRSFAQHHLPSPRAFAYPDAAFSEDAERAIAAHGYRAGLLLGDQVAMPNPLQLSRFVVPDEPRWVDQVLLPALGVRI